jgi:hypothetical protein
MSDEKEYAGIASSCLCIFNAVCVATLRSGVCERFRTALCCMRTGAVIEVDARAVLSARTAWWGWCDARRKAQVREEMRVQLLTEFASADVPWNTLVLPWTAPSGWQATTSLIAFDSGTWEWVERRFPDAAVSPPELVTKKLHRCGFRSRYDARTRVGKNDVRSWTVDALDACAVCYAALGVDGGPRRRKCGGCKCPMYCSKACQKTDWPIHQAVCGRVIFRVIREEDASRAAVIPPGASARVGDDHYIPVTTGR